MRIASLVLLLAATLGAAERKVDPTFLHRYLPDVEEKTVDITAPGCHYKPLFGDADAEPAIVRGVARYGEISLDANGSCKTVSYPAEEQVYVVLEGDAVLAYADLQQPLRRNDFVYLPAAVSHGLTNKSAGKVRVILMGFKLPSGTESTPIPKPLVANIDDVKKQQVGGHPPSTLYQLMMGDTRSTRDKIAAGRVLTSLYVMEFAPGGTNIPHHHDTEEEIYLLLDGRGEMVAGSGTDGVMGRYPVKPGDTYFFRMNATVGFYNTNDGQSHILAVRSLYPFFRGRGR